jgi:large subunit ribosomal protein L13
MKSYMASAENTQQEWFVIDAKDVVLGRLATKIASVLRGKHKPTYTPHADAGDFVVVVNADKVRLTGAKLDQKMYWWHTGHPGGIRGRSAREMLSHKPEDIITIAVRGMLPKNPLGRQMITKLKVHTTLPEHGYAAQQPKPLEM